MIRLWGLWIISAMFRAAADEIRPRDIGLGMAIGLAGLAIVWRWV